LLHRWFTDDPCFGPIPSWRWQGTQDFKKECHSSWVCLIIRMLNHMLVASVCVCTQKSLIFVWQGWVSIVQALQRRYAYARTKNPPKRDEAGAGTADLVTEIRKSLLSAKIMPQPIPMLCIREAHRLRRDWFLPFQISNVWAHSCSSFY